MRLQDRGAIVTGAASGIGQATAQLFAAEGAKVLAVDLDQEKVVAAHKGNERITPLGQDVSAADAPERIIKAALEACGRLDILMNNAGVSLGAPFEEFTDEAWDRTMAVNVTAHFKLARAAVPHLKASPAGRIINVASVMAEGTDYGLAAYCASKAGVAGLTRNMALELGRHGITSNYILPGAIRTGMTVNFKDEKIADIWARKSPLKRLGEPIDIARGALFLASDEGGFVTGHGLNVDGGLMLRV
ncbi:SDR family NAD(P)-dependent oxidoreductase [Tepidicaulis sp. LMO-SS28]|uniref:SDR family NAD(P)-dependent oxidoreductase n=1 Tax=Tepidicaulis sp. LMO-SS28 TaxID=3447455 RepID=UPI003EE3F92A